MKELRDLARRLLEDGTVKVVVGWEQGRRGPRPAFVTQPAGTERLVFDHRCVHNLATYLSPRRTAIAALGRPAVVVKGCDARAVAGLIRESQIARDHVVLIGVRCGGVVDRPDDRGELTEETVADRCRGCAAREPSLADHLLGELPPLPAGASRREAALAEMMAATPAGRWAFWEAELARCLRCNACREVCPLCFCERCLADKTRPQWVESSPHRRANLTWHVSRALHLAGRCVGCGECERACPVGVPLGLITRRVSQVVAERFGHTPNDDPAAPSPIGTFRSDDAQEFIL
jgi:ferredoxin